MKAAKKDSFIFILNMDSVNAPPEHVKQERSKPRLSRPVSGLTQSFQNLPMQKEAQWLTSLFTMNEKWKSGLFLCLPLRGQRQILTSFPFNSQFENSAMSTLNVANYKWIQAFVQRYSDIFSYDIQRVRRDYRRLQFDRLFVQRRILLFQG